MIKLDNPGVIVLVSVLSVCILLWTLPVALIGITCTLIIVIYICAILVTGENLVTRHAWLLRNYIVTVAGQFGKVIFSAETSGYVEQLLTTIKSAYREQVVRKMEQYRRRYTYQLSSESLVSGPGQCSTIEAFSPIQNRSRSISASENDIYVRGNTAAYENARPLPKMTSTPMLWKRPEAHNGDISGNSRLANRHTKKSSVSSSLNSLPGDESLEKSPWGTSISPKIRSRAAGIKTVQTIAGPLLASTRYNIDTKTYSDVTSPGLTSRLTKYATEANSKLIQSPYATGQFPRVNLNSSPTPLITSKIGKMRLPVTVRVAPPDTKYSPPERQRILSDICQPESTNTPPSVVQVLRDISLKRHASRDDIAADLIKKQRTNGLYGDELENLEEMTQKRARDDISRSDDDISVESVTSRPIKRTKKPSCYDIINSLTSSTNVSSGVKRKADISTSGSPKLGKHFKSYNSSPTTSELSKIPTDLQNVTKLVNKRTSTIEVQPISKTSLKASPSNSSLKSPPKESSSPTVHKVDDIFEDKKTSKMAAPMKLADRLFMKEEPQNIEKLKTFIDEHSSLAPKFSAGDEIKKLDIVNMRQTSMKAKLKSMFDAISGKTVSSIDPAVVIQAEPDNLPTAVATLSFSTSTTNVNTSPISTSAIVPIISKSRIVGTPGKHVTFNLPADTSITSLSQLAGQAEAKAAEEPNKTPLPAFSVPLTTAAATISFNSSTTATSTSTSSSASKTLIASGFNTTPKCVTSTPALFGSIQPSSFSVSPSTSTAVSSVGTSQATSILQSLKSTQSPSFSFGNTSVSAASVITPAIVPSQSTIPTCSQTSPKTSFQAVTTAPFASTSTTTLMGLFGASKPTSTTVATSASTFALAGPSTTSFGNSALANSTVNPAGFSFGTPSTVPSTVPGTSVSTQAETTTTTTSNAVSFAFGATTSSPAFGTGSNSTTATPTFGTSSTGTAVTTQSSGLNFGANSASTTSTFSCGSTVAAKPVFGFVAQTVSQATSSSTNPSFGTTSVPTFGTPSTSVPTFGTPSTSVPTFGTPSTSVPTFGTPSTSVPTFVTPSTSVPTFVTPSTSVPTFGTPSTSVPTFGTPSTSVPTFGTPSTGTPAFGTATVPAVISASAPAFGTGPTSTTVFGVTTTATPAFGTSSTSTAVTTQSSGFNFGANSATTTSTFSCGSTTAAKPGFAFGAPTTPQVTSSSTNPTIGTTTTTPAFGTTSTLTFGTRSTSAPAFGTPSTSGRAFGIPSSNSSTPAFGTYSATTQPSVFGIQSTPAFGTTASSIFQTPTTHVGNNTQATLSSATPQTTAPSVFGTPATTTSSSFGGSTFGTTPSSLFGGQPTTTVGFGVNTTNISSFRTASKVQAPALSNQTTTAAATVVFGSTNTSVPSFGTTSAATSFGTSTASVFGTSSTPVTSAFTSATASFGKTTSALPAFGTATTSTSGFGVATTTNNFGTPTTSSPAFGISGFGGFGKSGNSANNAASPFGNSTGLFGATTSSTAAPPYSASSGNSSAFGSNATIVPSNQQQQQQQQQPQQQQPQQNSIFTFNGNSANTSNSGFQFSGTATPQPDAFNFNASPAPGTSNAPAFSAPAFGASSGSNMFSIGSGSTASRSRSTRQARRQR